MYISMFNWLYPWRDLIRFCQPFGIMAPLNPLTLSRCGSNSENIFFKLIIQNSRLSTQCEIALMWMPLNPTNEKSALVQVMTDYWLLRGNALSRDTQMPNSSGALATPLRSVSILFNDLFNSSMLVFSCNQAALWMVQSACLSVCLSVRLSVCLSVCPSVCLSHLYHYVPIIVSSSNFQELLPITEVRSRQKVKVRGQRSKSRKSKPNLAISGP